MEGILEDIQATLSAILDEQKRIAANTAITSTKEN